MRLKIVDLHLVNHQHYCQTGPMVYIFMSQFVSGIGTTLFSILGITYLDDNVKRKQTPMLIGMLLHNIIIMFT